MLVFGSFDLCIDRVFIDEAPRWTIMVRFCSPLCLLFLTTSLPLLDCCDLLLSQTDPRSAAAERSEQEQPPPPGDSALLC